MPSEPDDELALIIAEDQIQAGVEEFMQHDPINGDPRLTVARIYAAMMLEGLTEAPPVDKSKLN